MKTIKYLLLFYALGVFGELAYAQPYESSRGINQSIGFGHVEVTGNELHYAFSGNPQQPGLLFVHGTPGNWKAFQQYLENKQLQQEFLIVSVDRMGWGKSIFASKKIDGNFETQARSIVAVMDQFPAKKWIVVGHSLGASMAPKIALIAPHRVAGLLLLAGSLDPKLGKPRWYNRAAHTWLAKRLIPASLGRSNNEIMPLSKQLALMSSQIIETTLSAKLVVMQGQKDKLVSPKNTRYVEKNWQGRFAQISLIDLPDAGHFLPWEQAHLVVEQIRKLARID